MQTCLLSRGSIAVLAKWSKHSWLVAVTKCAFMPAIVRFQVAPPSRVRNRPRPSTPT